MPREAERKNNLVKPFAAQSNVFSLYLLMIIHQIPIATGLPRNLQHQLFRTMLFLNFILSNYEMCTMVKPQVYLKRGWNIEIGLENLMYFFFFAAYAHLNISEGKLIGCLWQQNVASVFFLVEVWGRLLYLVHLLRIELAQENHLVCHKTWLQELEINPLMSALQSPGDMLTYMRTRR